MKLQVCSAVESVIEDKAGKSLATCWGNQKLSKALATELVRRWNAFEEGGIMSELQAVIADMLSGLEYLRQTNEIPYGFGIDRLEKTGKAALAKAKPE